jgi:uncharacterized protein YaiE (UPF0345 family)
MKRLMHLGLLALALFSFSKTAQAESAPKVLFTCAIGTKTASVTVVGKNLIYHYGTAKKDEMTIVGSAASKNVFQMAQRYAGMEYQLRFANAGVSYIVYSMEGNPQVGAAAISCLMVMRGTKTIADKSCAQWSELTLPDDPAIPQDTAAYSAM